MILTLVSPPRKLRSKKYKNCAKFVSEVAQKFRKVVPKLCTILHIFSYKVSELCLNKKNKKISFKKSRSCLNSKVLALW